jgi:hypothetical protein
MRRFVYRQAKLHHDHLAPRSLPDKTITIVVLSQAQKAKHEKAAAYPNRPVPPTTTTAAAGTASDSGASFSTSAAAAAAAAVAASAADVARA